MRGRQEKSGPAKDIKKRELNNLSLTNVRYKNFNLARRPEEKSLWFLTTSVGFSHLRPRAQMSFVSHLNLLIQLLYDDQTSLPF